MFRILLIGLLPLPSLQHFIPPLTWCQLADYCNHTRIPECGQRIIDSKIRKFLDECDMYEYNCDNNEEYRKVDAHCEETSTKETETPSTTTKTTTTTTTTTTTSTTTRPPESKTINCTRNSDKDAPVKTSSSKATQPPKSEDVTHQKTTNNVTSSTAVTDVNSETKEKTTKDVTSSTAMTDVNSETKNKSTEQVSPSSTLAPCRNYPEDCDRPHAWDTTAKGETRDFFQILRAKYGTRVKILRDTTHWPRRAQYVQNDDGMFKVGRHQDYL